MSGRAPHVVCVMAGIDPLEPRAHTVCEHCGERLVIELPVRVDVWVAANNAFIESHLLCRPKLQSSCNDAPSMEAEGAINREESNVK